MGHPSYPTRVGGRSNRAAWRDILVVMSSPDALPTRADALALMHEYTASESLRKHMLAVEAAMRAYAEHFGEDPERWGLAGLIHDFDYERYPNAAHSPTEEHPAFGVGLLARAGLAGGHSSGDPRTRDVLQRRRARRGWRSHCSPSTNSRG